MSWRGYCYCFCSSSWGLWTLNAEAYAGAFRTLDSEDAAAATSECVCGTTLSYHTLPHPILYYIILDHCTSWLVALGADMFDEI